MKAIWPEEPWEAHGCALGMSSPGKPLEERLTMLGRRSGWSRRNLLGAGLLLAAGAPLALVPWQVSAQERQGEGAQLAEQWEDVLLLDALRYLRLAPWQLQELRAISRVTDQRLMKLRDEEGKINASLRRIARKQREGLLTGQSVSLQEQANALLLEKTLKTGRERAAAEIVAYALPRVVRVLSPDQKVRALLLTHGEAPPNTARRPALLEPQSGFVMEQVAREHARASAVRGLLAQQFPASVVDSLNGIGNEYFLVTEVLSDDTLQGRFTDITITKPSNTKLGLSLKATSSTPPPNVPKPQFEAAQRESERLQKWPNLASEFVQNAAPQDLAEALGFHVRRLFTSPRFKIMIEERLRSGGQIPEDEPEGAPAGAPLHPG